MVKKSDIVKNTPAIKTFVTINPLILHCFSNSLVRDYRTANFRMRKNAFPSKPHEYLLFLLTNRIPRRWATLFFGWFSQIENLLLARLSIAIWQRCAPGLNLDEAKKKQFASLNDCFIRELREGARPVERAPGTVVSPCDAIVGAFGMVNGTELIQAKGFPYTLMDLLADQDLVDCYRDGIFVTLRLTPTMYHRFHAPCDCHISQVTYISGDTWNVNPITLRRVERLFCKNERAIVNLELAQPGHHITLVPVAAILVASMRFHFLDKTLDLRYCGPNQLSCDASLSRGQEMGYFRLGSTILVFASRSYHLDKRIAEGSRIRMGEALLKSAGS